MWLQVWRHSASQFVPRDVITRHRSSRVTSSLEQTRFRDRDRFQMVSTQLFRFASLFDGSEIFQKIKAFLSLSRSLSLLLTLSHSHTPHTHTRTRTHTHTLTLLLLLFGAKDWFYYFSNRENFWRSTRNVFRKKSSIQENSSRNICCCSCSVSKNRFIKTRTRCLLWSYTHFTEIRTHRNAFLSHSSKLQSWPIHQKCM